ncbi:MAG: cytochrome C oxidase subunit IV [Flavobacteriales bacterium]|nr:cytochrome C oxidase subunit IV [Flavobacteriales bacterium]|tara:strand:- start:753 stop:1070 length:318 start_codon:yes stop_codon:yes gene_type:complete
MSENNSTRHIWIVFWILLFLTAVEVLLGIFKPSFMLSNYLLGVTLLNMTFIILTIVKAYYIVAVFMHLGHEKKSLQISIVAPMWLLIPYLLFILLSEASFHGAIG